MFAKYSSTRANGTNIYLLSGTAEELAAYKKAKGSYYMEDEKTKQPLYFTTRLLNSTTDYPLSDNKVNLDNPASSNAAAQAMIDKVAAFGNIPLVTLQKAAALAQMGM